MSGPGRPDKNILVIVDCDGQQYEIRTYPNEYSSLMMLIYDQIYTEGFAECRGMGKCGTCLVEITAKRQQPTAYERNEDANLLKAGLQQENVRLACQLIVDEKLDGLTVKILNG
ncbi:MAG: 2Fe-2S iron-sulfur cluster-binding protein [Mucilaginibacter sp.]